MASYCPTGWPARLRAGTPATFWSSPAPNAACSPGVPKLLMSSHVAPALTYSSCFLGVTTSFPLLYHHDSQGPRPQFYGWFLRMWGVDSGIFLSPFPLSHSLPYLVPGWWECSSADSPALVPHLLTGKNEFEYRFQYEWGQCLIGIFLLVLVTLPMSKPKI